jgi:uncharacterized delta-60 repeat protein
MLKRSSITVILILVLFGIGTSQIQRWVYRYNRADDDDDWANSLVYGADGNVYIAGGIYGILTSYDFTVISLTSDGTQRWVYRYNGPAGYCPDVAHSLVYGSDGNIYVAGEGYNIGSGTYPDFMVVSLTSTGTYRWGYRYAGAGDYNNRAYSLVYGSDGNIYIAGESYGSGTSYDFTVISLTSTGNERWVYRYNGPGNFDDLAYSLVYGSDGNIYVAGESWGIGTQSDFMVISLTSTGDERWGYRYNGPGNSDDEASSLVQGSDGNLYVAGKSYGSGTFSDFTVISLTSTGSERWVYRTSGQGNSINDWANSLVYGADGNVYAAGRIYGNLSYQFTVISLSSTGTPRWVYSGPIGIDDWAYSLVYGADGNIYAAGGIYDTATSSDFTVISLTSTGSERWVYRHNGPGNGYDFAYSLVYGSDENLYSAGVSYGSGTDDFTVISLNPAIGIEEQTDDRLPHFAFCGFGNKLKFSLTLSEPANIPISIYNIAGEKAFSFTINASSGTSHYQKDLSFLPTGVFIVKADVEDRKITKKFVMVK